MGLGRSRLYAAPPRLAHSCVFVILKQFLFPLNRAPSAGPSHLQPLVISVLINLSKKQIKMIASKLSFAVRTFQLPPRRD